MGNVIDFEITLHKPAFLKRLVKKNWTQISTCYNILILTSLLEFCMCMLYHSYPSKYILYFHFGWFFWCTYWIVFSVWTWLHNLSNILPKMQDLCLPVRDTLKERKNTFGCSVIFFKIKSIWDKVFKNGPSKIWGREPFENLKLYGLLKQTTSLQILYIYIYTYIYIYI